MLMNVITSRRSIRKFTPDPVERSLIDDILEAGRLAPSAANIQPTRILVVQSPRERAKVASAAYGIGALADAPLVLIGLADLTAAHHVGERVAELNAVGALEPVDPASLVSGAGNPFVLKLGPDVAAECVCVALAYMNLQAVSLGLGTCWVHHFDSEELRASFGISDDFAIIAALAVGWPDESPAARPRFPSIEWSPSSPDSTR